MLSSPPLFLSFSFLPFVANPLELTPIPFSTSLKSIPSFCNYHLTKTARHDNFNFAKLTLHSQFLPYLTFQQHSSQISPLTYLITFLYMASRTLHSLSFLTFFLFFPHSYFLILSFLPVFLMLKGLRTQFSFSSLSTLTT